MRPRLANVALSEGYALSDKNMTGDIALWAPRNQPSSPSIPTMSPLIVHLGQRKTPRSPELVGPVNPDMRLVGKNLGSRFIYLIYLIFVPGSRWRCHKWKGELSPVKLMAPLPVATTLDPTCCSVIVKPWARWTQKSDVTAIAKSVSGRSFLCNQFHPPP